MTEPSPLYAPRPCRLLEVFELTPQEKLFRLRLANGAALGHRPGQFVQLSLPGLTEAPISVASSPERGPVFELAVRRAGRLTGALHRLAPGATLGIRGPFGRPFPLEDLHGRQLLLIAGGCGLAPLRSLIQYCRDHPERFASVQVLYGARSPADLLFRDELASWRNDRYLSCRTIVDRVPADSCYDGASGLLPELLAQSRIDPDNGRAVLVGPPPMYRPVIAALRRLGLDGARRILVSLERQMRCGVGKCGHCSIEHLTCCTDGPVFWLDEVEHLRGAL